MREQMTTELTILGWTLVLAIVQVLLPAMLRTSETGVDYNASPRDTPSSAPVGAVTARLLRAQSNLFETLPLFAAAILIAHVAGRNGELTFWGASLYLAARVLYVPLYAAGIPFIRSMVWTVGLVGLVMVLIAILMPA
jgi:uncharacterized MAPEG superfamily protein